MRIAILLQSCDETMGGIGIYTQEIVRSLLRLDSTNEYLLVYPGFGVARTRRGQFGYHKNVTEIETAISRMPLQFYRDQIAACVPCLLQKLRALVPLETYWDQVVVPRVAEQYGVDVVFNPHLTFPFEVGSVRWRLCMRWNTIPCLTSTRGECTHGGTCWRKLFCLPLIA